jgi:cytochrome P450
VAPGRRIVLGGGARDDVELTDLLTASCAPTPNWSYLKPPRADLRDAFLDRLGRPPAHERSRAASPPSWPRRRPRRTRLRASRSPSGCSPSTPPGWRPSGPWPSSPPIPRPPRACARNWKRTISTRPQDLPYLRACVLESLRLWPTTPAVLRDTTAETHWDGGLLPAGAGVVIFAPFFHRDAGAVLHADAFAPGLWLDAGTPDGTPPDGSPFVPFSDGPAACPGRSLVLLVTTTLLDDVPRRPRDRPPDRAGAARPASAAAGHAQPFRLRFGF